MKLTIPPGLQKGDTIGIISPSAGLAPFAMHRINRGVQYLQTLGFRVVVGAHALENDGYVSSSITSRLSDLHGMFSNPEVKAIITTIGGNNANQLLPHIDYQLIKKNPKIFMGYSDITVLHFALLSQAGLATYYGPCLMTQFGEYPKPLAYTIKSFLQQTQKKRSISKEGITPSRQWTDEVLNWFEKKDLRRARKLYKNKGYLWFHGGTGSGPLWGGTIPSMNYLLGTKYWIFPKKSVIFLDLPEGNDINSGISLSEVDAHLTQLDSAGVFSEAQGLIIGRPYRYTQKEHEALQGVVVRIVGKYDIPIVSNVNIGHVDPIISLRYGQNVRIDSKNNTIKMYSKT